MINYSKEEIKTHGGFDYIERNGLRYFILEGMDKKRWMDLRKLDGAIGGSDMGTLMGWSEYKSKVELFYECIGLIKAGQSIVSRQAFWGTVNESNVLDIAQYYNFGDPSSYLFKGSKKREIVPFPYSVRNPEIPWLNINVDGLIDYNQETVRARRVAESKTIQASVYEKYNSIPPYHLGQILIYLAGLKPMLDEDVAEIYYLKDGNDFYGLEIPQNNSITDMMITAASDFFNRVNKGKEILLTVSDVRKRQKFLNEIQPGPDDTPAYEKFIKSSWKTRRKYITIEGRAKIQDTAREYVRLDKQIKELKKDLQYHKNVLLDELNTNGADTITFEGGGRVHFNKIRLYVDVD